jgi:hemerythrin
MSEIIIWDDKYLTEIATIDSQHKIIFKRVNELFQACENLSEKEYIIKLVNSLDFYTNCHFDTEEEYMLKYEYSEYESHKKAHNNFKNVYEQIKNNYNYEKSQATYMQAIHLSQTLADWLDHHLQNEDKRLAEFLKNKVVQEG